MLPSAGHLLWRVFAVAALVILVTSGAYLLRLDPSADHESDKGSGWWTPQSRPAAWEERAPWVERSSVPPGDGGLPKRTSVPDRTHFGTASGTLSAPQLSRPLTPMLWLDLVPRSGWPAPPGDVAIETDLGTSSLLRTSQ